MFFLSLFMALKPINWREVIIFVLACTSSMVIFALERANVDVIFFSMVVTAGLLSTGPVLNRLLSYALLLFAGLLKFYPLIALVTALRERPRISIIALISIATVCCFSLTTETSLRMSCNVPAGGAESGPFGAECRRLSRHVGAFVPHLRDSRASSNSGSLRRHLLIATCIQVTLLSRNPNFSQLFLRMAERDKALLTLGSAIMAGCFYAGRSIEYRGVYLILVVAGLVALRRAAARPRLRAMLDCTTFIAVFLMWEALFRHALEHNGSPPKGLNLPFHLFWLLRELLWWYLGAVLPPCWQPSSSSPIPSLPSASCGHGGYRQSVAAISSHRPDGIR